MTTRTTFRMQKWSATWESATGSGNDIFKTGTDVRKHQVWKDWERQHPGCYIQELTSLGVIWPEQEQES